MRFLLLYDGGYQHVQTVYDYAMAFRKYTRHDMDFFNVDDDLDADLDFSGYDAAIINYCVLCVGRHDVRKSYIEALIPALARFGGYKIQVEQDPYDQTNNMKTFMIRIGADAVLTTIPIEHVRAVYCESIFDDVQFKRVLTGFIDDSMISGPPPLPLAERPIPLGYRGRECPWRIGDMGWHKSEVGHRFKAACQARGINCDIEVTEEKRFHGGDWMRFVRSCRVMLGVPSGANIFDWDSSLHEEMVRRWKRNPKLQYSDVRDDVEKLAVSFDMGQISPRVFEAVTSRTALAMLRGAYSGVLEPGEHYVPIEQDYSNIDQVLDQIVDLDAMQAMTDRAYDHVVGSNRYHYRDFVAEIDDLLEANPRVPPNPSAPPLRVTQRPLGNDAATVSAMFELRGALKQLAQLARANPTAAERHRCIARARKLLEANARAYDDPYIEKKMAEFREALKQMSRLLHATSRQSALVMPNPRTRSLHFLPNGDLPWPIKLSR